MTKKSKSSEDYIEIFRTSTDTLAKAKRMVEELKIMRPKEIHVVQAGQEWQVVSYIYSPVK